MLDKGGEQQQNDEMARRVEIAFHFYDLVQSPLLLSIKSKFSVIYLGI